MKKKAIFYLVIEFEAGVSTSKFISVANFGLFYDKIFTKSFWASDIGNWEIAGFDFYRFD